MSAKHLPVFYSQKMEEEPQNNEDQLSSSSEDSGEDSKKVVEAKKPQKITRRQRTQRYIMKIKDDNMDQVMNDILNENKRLRRELEALRVANTSLKREYEELTHALLADRLKNQIPDLEF